MKHLTQDMTHWYQFELFQPIQFTFPFSLNFAYKKSSSIILEIHVFFLYKQLFFEVFNKLKGY